MSVNFWPHCVCACVCVHMWTQKNIIYQQNVLCTICNKACRSDSGLNWCHIKSRQSGCCHKTCLYSIWNGLQVTCRSNEPFMMSSTTWESSWNVYFGVMSFGGGLTWLQADFNRVCVFLNFLFKQLMNSFFIPTFYFFLVYY